MSFWSSMEITRKASKRFCVDMAVRKDWLTKRSHWSPHNWIGTSDVDYISFFPTCQVRVVRFYQSCSPPPPPRLAVLLLLVLPLLPSTWDLPSSVCWAHCWTSTRDRLSSVCTAGPQPGTCPAQCAPLDLNLGFAQRSVHRWTSTGDLPSSCWGLRTK